MGNTTRLIAGAMSGTSADGVDVAIVAIDGRGYAMTARLLHHHARPYPRDLREAIFAARSGRPMMLSDLARLGRDISLVYAAAVNEAVAAAGIASGDLAAIAAHGQTLYHDPPNTIQWLDPALVAAETGCPVVSDFRRADCALGGQGAPLVPFADYILFRHSSRGRVLVNIGGIANLTAIPAGAELGQVLAFDTGPGNCISDWLIRRCLPDARGYDDGGELALRGRSIEAVVDAVLATPYFRQRPPKSTDGPAMIALFEQHAARHLCPDALPPLHATAAGVPLAACPPVLSPLLATAAAITARALADAIARFLPSPPDEVIVSGGGTRNAAIMRDLAAALPGVPLLLSTDLGVPSEAKEAIAFALLGAATLDGIPANVPSATGARRLAVLGAVTPKP